jgi:hypothetical protein
LRWGEQQQLPPPHQLLLSRQPARWSLVWIGAADSFNFSNRRAAAGALPMRPSYANWQLALLAVLLMSAFSAELWLHSDLRLKRRSPATAGVINAKITVRCPCRA